jgi:hypothetical protein
MRGERVVDHDVASLPCALAQGGRRARTLRVVLDLQQIFVAALLQEA